MSIGIPAIAPRPQPSKNTLDESGAPPNHSASAQSRISSGAISPNASDPKETRNPDGLAFPRLNLPGVVALVAERASRIGAEVIQNLTAAATSRQAPADESRAAPVTAGDAREHVTEARRFITRQIEAAAPQVSFGVARSMAEIPAAYRSSALSAEATPELTEFKRQVYDAGVRRNLSPVVGREFVAGVPPEHRATVEGNVVMESTAAKQVQRLLSDARAELALAQAAGEPRALATDSVGVQSGMRSAAHQLSLWDRSFQGYYNAAVEQGRIAAGDYSAQAVEALRAYVAQRLATPGFSNHQSGRAVDFSTTVDGKALAAQFGNPAWQNSWFHQWLQANADAYGFKPLAGEPWHWDYRPGQ